MGAITRYKSFSNCTYEEFRQKWAFFLEDDVREYGEDYYGGAFKNAQYTKHPKIFRNSAELEKAMGEIESGLSKGYGVFIQIGNPEKFDISQDKKGSLLLKAKQTATTSLSLYLASIMHRTLMQKSQTKGCTKCGCSFSKKGLEIIWGNKVTKHLKPSEQMLLDSLVAIEKMHLREPWEKETYLRNRLQASFLTCPICTNDEFLVTETDKKRFSSLNEKFVKAEAAYFDYQKIFRDKLFSKKEDHGWQVIACLPS